MVRFTRCLKGSSSQRRSCSLCQPSSTSTCAASRMPWVWHMSLRQASVPGTRLRWQVACRPARLSERMANSTPLLRSRWQEYSPYASYSWRRTPRRYRR